ncbi:MAG TPA: MFS transporter, partial [Gammaproteobacteria bacterium]|nr:MFS transporter [Gammaproteobacteria bacterium]
GRTHNIRTSLVAVTANRKLLLLYVSIFILHMLLMANFVVIPLTLRDAAGVDAEHHWHIYLPVLVISGVLMFPCLMLGEKFRRVNQMFGAAIVLMIIAQYGFIYWHHTALQIGVVMLFFFLSFNYLEASLPSLISKSAPPEHKGTALGIYSTGQFIGIFTGGAAGGYLYDHTGINSVFVFGCVMSIIWLLCLVLVRNPIKHRQL